MATPGREETARQQGTSRRVNIGANVFLQLVLAAVVLVMVNYLSMRHYRRFDWTSNNIYTLSEQTQNVLRGLSRDVSVIVMMSQADGLYGDTREMLERYVAKAGARLNVRYVDPDQNPVEFQHLLEQYPVNAGITAEQEIVVEQVIVVTCGESSRFVTPNEDFVGEDAADPMAFGAPASFNPPRAETAMTSAIYRVVAGRQRVICVTTGHGEWSVGPGSDRSLSDLSEHLERYEVELRPVTFAIDRAPELDECDALVVAGPGRPFLPGQARHIQEYATEQGGDVMLLLDPLVQEGRFVPTGLEGVARNLGVELAANEVVDRRATAPFCGGGHPTGFIALSRQTPVCVVRARSVSPLPGRQGEPFLETVSDDAFGETNVAELSQPRQDDGDRPGPLLLGVVVEQDNRDARNARIERQRADLEAELPESEQRGGRLVVVGDSDFLGSEYRQNPRLGNFNLVVGLFNAVADNTVLVAQPPREVERSQLTLTDAQLGMAQLLIVIILPLLALVAGMAVWWTRRQ